MTSKPRDRHDHIIVQEKLDGSNVAVAHIDGEIVALVRAGYRANTSPFPQHHLFDRWVGEHVEYFRAVLRPGEWVCGEWLALAHGTVYALGDREPFVVFDLFSSGERVLYDTLRQRVGETLTLAPLLHEGKNSLPVSAAMAMLGEGGQYGAVDPPEGAVWRCERKGRVEFLAKYVRADKTDGKYLPELSGGAPVWNWRPAG